MSKRKFKIIFTGGGTGGHIFPLVAVARELKKIQQREPSFNFEIYYFGPKEELAKKVFPQEGIKVKWILSGKIRRYANPSALILTLFDLLFKIPLGFLKAFFYLFFMAPDVVFSKGGFGAFPTTLAAWILQIPIFLHESDSIAGLVNRISAKFSKETFTSFPKTEGIPQQKQIVVGNPIREEVLKGSFEEGKKIFNLVADPKKPILLIMGGSQGAVRINNMILDIITEWLSEFELIHIVGPKNEKEIKKEMEILLPKDLKPYYHCYGFLEEKELASALASCHLVISRASAGSIFEIAAVGKPSILIPLPESAQDHQRKNAYAYADKGAAIVIEQGDATPHFVLERAKYILSYPEKYKEMAQKALLFSRPKAGKIIAEYLFVFLTA